MEIAQSAQAVVTSLDELKAADVPGAQIATFEQAMGGSAQGIGGTLLGEIGEIKQQFVEAKQSLQAELATPGDDPNSLMQMQWSLMRITMQEELIAKTVGKMSQNVETLLKTQ
ncbi:type III secretion system inner rod subunit SctI [Aeromonas jandaei]|uniref:Type III secretion system inner rod subunit SctI n=1 Tax=Aeromonas jandaei TaxID=650 RepID=A0A2S5FF02_AERJA|nr:MULTISPECIES: type III secretion system inner rod subunit SctI [Aeromonas]KIQ81941.1 preprotein translocase I [Aeromonas sp. L_1B5_3]MBL0545554.1 type III secretion system inner rod subunit SctI [Aeromonas jandaei]MBL0609114.1 type III secretion system inner rod subunit SctI [Aeromonas jandaei]MBL0665471.1 type III secretion system inner rod subunit SctI [Aeromonas jandaei]MBM0490198.1 EscI/YscI/HrpB family type III secretion system inner rod protein [Aeromonas jandaei]